MGMGPSKYNKEDFLDAIPGTLGIKSHIAKKIGCKGLTVANWIRNDADVRQAWIEERQKLQAKAVEGLAYHLSAHEWKAIAFVLTHMTDDGTFEAPAYRHEHSGVGGGPVQITQMVEIRDSAPNDKD